MANGRGESGSSDILFSWAPKPLQIVDCSHEIKTLAPRKKSYDQPRQHIKKQRRYFADKGQSSQSYGFSSPHVWMWELEHKEGWVQNWCFWIVVLERTLESLLGIKIKPVNPIGNQPWIFTGRTDAEAPKFGHLMGRTNSLEKTLLLGKTEGIKEMGVAEDEMVR